MPCQASLANAVLDVRHLSMMHALRAGGSLAAAADELCVSASAVSHQLKELESYYGTQLVNRKNRPISFTPAGLELLALSSKVLPELAHTDRAIKALAHGQIGQLRLASECHSCFDWLMPILNRYRKLWSDVELDFATGFEPEPHQALLDKDTDVLITASALPITGLCYLPLFKYESRLVLAPSHPLSQKDTISPADLATETLISYPVEQARLDVMAHFLLPNGVAPAHHRTTELTAMLIQLVASERGVAALPDWVVADYEKKGWVVSRALGAGLYCQLYAATRTADNELSFVQGFLKLLASVVKP